MRRTKDLKMKLLGLAGMVMMMCFMFVHCSIITLAAEGKVTASSAKIRKDASTSSDVVGGAVQNETYTITGEKTGADGKVWYQITFEGNKTGYIRSDLMTKVGETSTPSTPGNTGATYAPTVAVTDVQPISATITGSAVRVRSDASTNGDIITSVVRDVVVTITGQAVDSQNKTWYRVNFSTDSGDVTGFIREDFLSVSGTVTPIVNDPVETPPVVDDPVVTPPAEPTPVPAVNDYEVIKENGVWFFVDNKEGYKYNAAQTISAIKTNQELLEGYQKKIKSQKTTVVVLVILVIGLGILATLLFLKVKDVMDEAYFTAVEKETIRQRQGQKANNGSSPGSKSVMQTVGAGGNTAKQGVPKPTSVPKPTTTGKPVQQKPANGAPQTVKVSNPEETKARPVQQRPAQQQTQQRPVQQQTQQKPAQPQQKPVQQKPADTANKQSWQSKNFVPEEDDEFEFEFLNWDGSEEN